MKTSDISQTPLVRKYGIRGARLYLRLWFPLMYVLLIACATALWIVAADLAKGWRRVLFGCLVCGLTVLAASLLTRMRLGFLAGIELLEGQGTPLGSSTPVNRLPQLQRWYASHCNGKWEHAYGIKIDSLDNPGWWVKIHLTGTELERVSFDPRLERKSEVEWLDCKVKDKIFDGAGDPLKLETILALFVDWAEQHQRVATQLPGK